MSVGTEGPVDYGKTTSVRVADEPAVRATLSSECSGHGCARQFATRAGDRRWRVPVF